MSHIAPVNANDSSCIIFDANIFRLLSGEGVSIENIASCFLVSVEELIAEVKKTPELVLAFAQGRAEHLLHMYRTLKSATSPSLIGLMARTDGFGKAPKPKEAQSKPFEAETLAEAQEAADAALAMLNREESGSRSRAAHAVSRPDSTETPKMLAERIEVETEAAGRRIRLDKQQSEVMWMLEHTPRERELSRSQIRKVERQIQEAQSQHRGDIAALFTEQATRRGITLKGQ